MANKYSFYQLRMACQQHIMASLYTDPDDPDAFTAGYVEAVTQRHALIWSVTPWGQFDGWCLRRTEDILQVFMGDDFEVRLQMLVEMEDTKYAPLLSPPVGPEEDLQRRVLQLAQQREDIISFQTEEDTYTGTIVNLDDLRASVALLDFFGAPDDTRQFPLREMQIITLGTQEERMYLRLSQERNKPASWGDDS